MANAESIGKARRSLTRELGHRLDELGKDLTDLGMRISDDDKEPEARAADLFSDKSRMILANIFRSEVHFLNSALQVFDDIVKRTEDGGKGTYEFTMDRDNFNGEAGLDKLHNLIGRSALVKRYLEKADFKIAVTQEGRRIVFTCSR